MTTEAAASARPDIAAVYASGRSSRTRPPCHGFASRRRAAHFAATKAEKEVFSCIRICDKIEPLWRKGVAMANCAKCSLPLDENAKFCTSCGAAVSVGQTSSATARRKTFKEIYQEKKKEKPTRGAQIATAIVLVLLAYGCVRVLFSSHSKSDASNAAATSTAQTSPAPAQASPASFDPTPEAYHALDDLGCTDDSIEKDARVVCELIRSKGGTAHDVSTDIANTSKVRVELSRMAEAGNAYAAFTLGASYADCMNPPDRDKSLAWLKSAAEHGLIEAQLTLAGC